MRSGVIAALLCIGCGVQVSNDESGVTDDPDDQADSDFPDDDDGASPDAGQPESPACFNGRVVYLNFEGQTLTDATTSDATLNQASWMTIAAGTAPKYRANSPSRDADIAAIVDGVRTQLATFPVTVVTTRPASGPYVMIVFGGHATDVGSRFNGAVNELDCGDVQNSDVAWISDTVNPTQRVVNYAIGAIGFGLGLTATTNPSDCMCSWDNSCVQPANAACTLSAMIDRDPNADQLCAGATTQDEVAAFRQAFCQ
ncbi:MAG: hypothetical protein AB7O24_05190 [Kofleriaceae bacterium]